MELFPAPYFADVAKGPENAAAYWLHASDGLRIRIAAWGGGTKGTVLIFPGRTEYVEKYGDAALEFQKQGYSSIAIDWRGQGLAERLLPERSLGHVGKFSDYQLDIAVVLEAIDELELPKPLHLMAHSMGGCIGLRAVMDGLPVRSAAYSAPMWGVQISTLLRPCAWTISTISRHVGLGATLTPGTASETYVMAEPFEDNSLTTDAAMFAYMKTQVTTYGDLALGGPSLHWLNESLNEMRNLSKLPSPSMPSITFLGTNERIVDPGRITARMGDWPQGALHMIDGAEHEVMMEKLTTRTLVYKTTIEHFEAS